MAKLALIVYRHSPGIRERRLVRTLEFFGVPCQTIDLANLSDAAGAVRATGEYAILASVDVVAAAVAMDGGADDLRRATAVYAYAAEDRAASLEALSSIAGVRCSWTPVPADAVPAAVSAECPDFTGPMSGVRASIRLRMSDGLVSPVPGVSPETWTPLISAGDGVAFARLRKDGVETYVCTSAAMVDIDAPVPANYYDVKNDFLAAVPLVMFVTWAFREVMWRPYELGACFVIDDPLLKTRYGLCDFQMLRDAMRTHGFTTSIAFIPWNWRRTRRAASTFFQREADVFSVSVHGCDHVSAEFGATAPEEIDNRARLAQTRMRKHESRTHIHHDPVMIFPQGVFSSICPAVLKRNGFVAAVNTEISPVDADAAGAGTRVRDVWDTAIMRYGSFPLYTRRYHHHGLENFAFDLLLGKPCLIVAHHEFFRDGGAALLGLVDELNALNCRLQWRSLREVVRRAYRLKDDGDLVRIQMYATELRVTNPSPLSRDFHFSRHEDDGSPIARITIGGADVAWNQTPDGVEFRSTLAAGDDALVRVDYHRHTGPAADSASLRYEFSVAMRRVLCEVRDQYLHRLRA